MVDKSGEIKAYWDGVFAGEIRSAPADGRTGNDGMDRGLSWLCDGAKTVLDFGCGNGSLLFRCAYRGTADHIGIDLSSAGIAQAQAAAEDMPCGQYRFIEGGIGALQDLAENSVDGVILSNIIDNVDMDGAIQILYQAHRIARGGARLFVKLNAHLSPQQITDWNIRTVEGDLLDDGLLLLNLPTDRWLALFDRYFQLFRQEDVYYKEHDQTNRLFLLVNKPLE